MCWRNIVLSFKLRNLSTRRDLSKFRNFKKQIKRNTVRLSVNLTAAHTHTLGASKQVCVFYIITHFEVNYGAKDQEQEQ